MRRKLAAGNWKMNGTSAALDELRALGAAHPSPGCDVVLCPPVTLLPTAAQLGLPFLLGAQDCHAAEGGAHTGDVSAEMLADAGAAFVIVGHSERRADHGETDAMVRAKAQAAWRAGLVAIVCVGETDAERDAGETLEIVERQIANSVPDRATGNTTVIAYEPIWAIGTGRTPNADDIAEVHAAMRRQLRDRYHGEGDGIRLLYGGSVKPGNAAEIFAIDEVDGGLVGGASLKASDFAEIVAAASR